MSGLSVGPEQYSTSGVAFEPDEDVEPEDEAPEEEAPELDEEDVVGLFEPEEPDEDSDDPEDEAPEEPDDEPPDDELLLLPVLPFEPLLLPPNE